VHPYRLPIRTSPRATVPGPAGRLAATVALLALAGGLTAGCTAGNGPGPDATASPDAAPSSAGTPPAATPPVTAPAATATPAGGGDALRCHTGGLTVALNPSAGGGAAGSVFEVLTFTNTSGHGCRMYGFPGMLPTTAAGMWITDVTVARTDEKPALVPLAPGGAAYALVRWSHVDGGYTGAACQPGASGLVVTPPDETTQATVHFPSPDRICGDGTLTVGPVVATRPGG
jgi:hypothetical protein